jgi:hypothetical protein
MWIKSGAGVEVGVGVGTGVGVGVAAGEGLDEGAGELEGCGACVGFCTGGALEPPPPHAASVAVKSRAGANRAFTIVALRRHGAAKM